MTTIEVFHALQARDIQLTVDADRLAYDAPEGTVTEEVLTLLRQHKAALLALLTQLSTWTKVLPHFTLLENQSCISFQTVGESLQPLRTDVGRTHKPKTVTNNTS